MKGVTSTLCFLRAVFLISTVFISPEVVSFLRPRHRHHITLPDVYSNRGDVNMGGIFRFTEHLLVYCLYFQMSMRVYDVKLFDYHIKIFPLYIHYIQYLYIYIYIYISQENKSNYIYCTYIHKQSYTHIPSRTCRHAQCVNLALHMYPYKYNLSPQPYTCRYSHPHAYKHKYI